MKDVEDVEDAEDVDVRCPCQCPAAQGGQSPNRDIWKLHVNVSGCIKGTAGSSIFRRPCLEINRFAKDGNIMEYHNLGKRIHCIHGTMEQGLCGKTPKKDGFHISHVCWLLCFPHDALVFLGRNDSQYFVPFRPSILANKCRISFSNFGRDSS